MGSLSSSLHTPQESLNKKSNFQKLYVSNSKSRGCAGPSWRRPLVCLYCQRSLEGTQFGIEGELNSRVHTMPDIMRYFLILSLKRSTCMRARFLSGKSVLPLPCCLTCPYFLLKAGGLRKSGDFQLSIAATNKQLNNDHSLSRTSLGSTPRMTKCQKSSFPRPTFSNPFGIA